jgi:hypothetical protein
MAARPGAIVPPSPSQGAKVLVPQSQTLNPLAGPPTPKQNPPK